MHFIAAARNEWEMLTYGCAYLLFALLLGLPSSSLPPFALARAFLLHH